MRSKYSSTQLQFSFSTLSAFFNTTFAISILLASFAQVIKAELDVQTLTSDLRGTALNFFPRRSSASQTSGQPTTLSDSLHFKTVKINQKNRRMLSTRNSLLHELRSASKTKEIIAPRFRRFFVQQPSFISFLTPQSTSSPHAAAFSTFASCSREFLGMESTRKRPSSYLCDWVKMEGDHHTSLCLKSTEPNNSNVLHNYSERPRQNDQDVELSRPNKRPLVIVLAGPTAVGKSDVAAELCSSIMASDILQGHGLSNHSDNEGCINSKFNRTRGHVVSADSVQAYRGVDIGANKPTLDEMIRTPHHLVNVVDPPDSNDSSSVAIKASSYNAADWMRDARYVIGKLTLLDYEDDEIGSENNCNDETLQRRKSIEDVLNQTLCDNLEHQQNSPVLPVVVGGTMMYLQWLVHGRPDAIRPTEIAVERAAKKISEFRRDRDADPSESEGNIEIPDSNSSNQPEAGSSTTINNNVPESLITDDDSIDMAEWEEASKYVSSLGHVFMQRVQKLSGRDWYRLRRLLEVAYTIAERKKESNTPVSVQSEEEILRNITEEQIYTGIRSGSLPELGYDVRCFFLCPSDRMVHFETVDKRCEEMLLRGLIKETATLYMSGGLPEESQVTRAIGYRQTLEYLKRENAKSNDGKALASFIDDFATATRQYAKKQMQWFRRDEDFAFIPVNMGLDKEVRVKDTATLIAEMCKLQKINFETELSTPAKIPGKESKKAHVDTCLPLSARAKLENEVQGKKMKFFASKRHKLVEGSVNFCNVLLEADKCTKLIQNLGEDF